MALKVSRRGRIAPFIAMDVMAMANARVAAGHDVVHLEVGQPSTAAPEAVIELARDMLERDRLGYTEAFGTSPLRARIAAHYRDSYGASVDPDRIAVTTGSSGAFILGFLAAFDAGDRVAFAAPGYPAYRNILTALDLEPVVLPATLEQGFQPSAALLDALPSPPDGLILASPANPTGTMIEPAALEALIAWCRAHGVRIVSDEIYHGITYGKVPQTLAGRDEGAIVINSFSKYFSMTGWRLGWMVVPRDLMRAVECLAQNFFISPPTLSQHAAVAVFDCRDALDANVARYARNRELLLRALPACGFGPIAPADGAFYVYAGIGDLGGDSVALARELLDQLGVAVTPGTDFDADRGGAFMRFSYAGSTEEVEEAVRRLTEWRRRNSR